MTYKIIISMRVEPSNENSGNNQHQLDVDKLDFSPLATWLTTNILTGDKVSIVFPDTYIDVNFENSEPYPDTLVNNFREFVLTFMNNSKKPSKNGIVKVRGALDFITDSKHHIKAPPRWITFMVRGSSKLTTSVWGTLFMQMCLPVKDDALGHRHWPLHSLELSQLSFKDVAESCFGTKFKDEPITVGWLLESDQVEENGKLKRNPR